MCYLLFRKNIAEAIFFPEYNSDRNFSKAQNSIPTEKDEKYTPNRPLLHSTFSSQNSDLRSRWHRNSGQKSKLLQLMIAFIYGMCEKCAIKYARVWSVRRTFFKACALFELVLEHEPEIMACAYICFHELFSNHCNLYKHLFNSFENQILSLIFFKFVFDNMYVCIRVWKKGKEKNSKTERFFPQKKSNDFLAKMVFCFLNCSDLLWEKNVLLVEKNFWNSRLKAENLQKFWDH